MRRLRNVQTGDKVSAVGNQAFYMCYNVTNIVCGTAMTAIGPYAFQGCNSLATLCFLGGPVAAIDETAVTITARISVENGNPVVDSVPEIVMPGYVQTLKGKVELADPDWVTVTDDNKPTMHFFKIVYEKETK